MTELLENEITLDKSALKDFAIKARRKLKERVELQAKLMGFYEDNRAVNYEFEDDRQVKINGEFFSKKQVETLQREIKSKGYENLIDEVAYTWFNRFIALYYMEVNGYSENNFNIISNIDNLNQFAVSVSSQLNDEEKQTVISAVQNNNQDTIFKTLLIHQCNVMNKKLPFLFEQIQDYTELLFPQGMNSADSVIKEMLSLDKSNWQVVEIIGWLYQYYNQAEKDRVIQAKKRYKANEIPYATQLFTPKWIVKYMTQNSLGRLWQEAHSTSKLKDSMEFYLEPRHLTDEDKKELESHIMKGILPEQIKVFDPACGSGHILVYAYSLLYLMYKESGYIESDIPSLILKNNLFGLDICNRAVQLAQFAVMMRAYQDDKNILNKITSINVVSIQETNWIDERVKEALMNGVENQLLAQQQIKNLVETFKDAKIYGSIIKVKDFDFDFWEQRLIDIQSLNMGLLYTDVIQDLKTKLPILIQQASIMQQQYECVITNPPYMGNKYMEPRLAEFIQKEYKDVKSDLFSTFMEYAINKTATKGHLGFMTPFVWMFIPTYKELRINMLRNTNITTLIQLEYSGFEGATVPICTFSLIKNRKNKEQTASYIKLSDFPGPTNQPIKALEAKKNKDCGWYYENTTSNLMSIPSCPIAYWVSSKFQNLFSTNNLLKDFIVSAGRTKTHNDEKYLRLWHEVSKQASYWKCCNKGGNYRKWYGNLEYVINWSKEATLEYASHGGLRNEKFIDCEGITWGLITSSNSSFRIKIKDSEYTSAAPVIVVKPKLKKYILALLNNKISNKIIKLLNPTLNLTVGDIQKIPFYYTNKDLIIDKINSYVEKNIQISKDDWDSFETSWDFEQHPLLRFSNRNKGLVDYKNIHKVEPITAGDKVQDCFNKWKEYKQEQFNKLKANEEELNKLFIEIYGLQDEMTPEVDNKDITVALADELRDIKSLLSYAIGCMFGRYSLDEKGLIYAGGEFDKSRYQDLEVDEDGILPILSDTWFDDDIIEEFKRFLKKAFGELYFNENMQYIADVLGRKGSESAEDRIRTYFLKDFYKDHLQIYKKRPIYWMFTSGKEKAFNALIYLHRYDKTTLSRIRKDYLHEFQNKLDNAIQRAENEGNVKLTSLYSKYQTECLEFDRKIKDLADEQIELDLDDGVKVNYAKFQGLLEAEKDIVGKKG